MSDAPDNASAATAQTGHPASPWITVLIAVWNREETIRRCIDSVLAQSFSDFEIVAVDDCSTDRSVDIVRRYDDARIRILRRQTNGGPWAALYSGIRAAGGKWILHLGSDDELLPGALGRIAELTRAAAPDVGLVGMSYVYDDGSTGPQPAFPGGDLDFERWLEWTDRASRLDALACYRRAAFDDLACFDDVKSLTQFMMRLIARWRMRVDPQPGGLVHTDAANRQTTAKALLLPTDRMLTNATAAEEVAREFGQVMRLHAPRRYKRLSFMAGRWYLLAGKRRRGARSMLAFLVRQPACGMGWAHLLAGLLGPKVLLGLIARRKRLQARRAARIQADAKRPTDRDHRT